MRRASGVGQGQGRRVLVGAEGAGRCPQEASRGGLARPGPMACGLGAAHHQAGRVLCLDARLPSGWVSQCHASMWGPQQSGGKLDMEAQSPPGWMAVQAGAACRDPHILASCDPHVSAHVAACPALLQSSHVWCEGMCQWVG